MNIYDAIFPIFCLLVGVPCLLTPRQVQRFALAFNEKMGHREELNSFRRSEKYVGRLRKLGFLTILGGTIVVLIDVFAEDVVRAVIYRRSTGRAGRPAG